MLVPLTVGLNWRMSMDLFVVLSGPGPARDMTLGTRQQPYWNDHAEFIDRLVTEGFIVLGGPFEDEGGAMIVVRARSENEVRARLADDPWYRQGVLNLERVTRWTMFIDQRLPSPAAG